MSTSGRVAGHELLSEGAPFDARGKRLYPGSTVFGTGGRGRGACSCGTTSEELTSASLRKAWHRAHKTVVLLGRVPNSDVSESGRG